MSDTGGGGGGGDGSGRSIDRDLLSADALLGTTPSTDTDGDGHRVAAACCPTRQQEALRGLVPALRAQRDAVQRELDDERVRRRELLNQEVNAIVLQTTEIWRAGFNDLAQEKQTKVESAQAVRLSERQAADCALSELADELSKATMAGKQSERLRGKAVERARVETEYHSERVRALAKAELEALEALEAERRASAAERAQRKELADALEAERAQREELAAALEAECAQREELAAALEAERAQREELAEALEAERSVSAAERAGRGQLAVALQVETERLSLHVRELAEALEVARRAARAKLASMSPSRRRPVRAPACE